MPTCKDCRFYKPIDEENDDCFGPVVSGDMDVEKCPLKAFQPKNK